MKINFYATLRQIVGQKSIEYPVEGAITARSLIDGLIQAYPGLREELLDEDGELLERVHVLVNGRDVPYLQDAMQTEITARDTVNVFPAVGGG